MMWPGHIFSSSNILKQKEDIFVLHTYQQFNRCLNFFLPNTQNIKFQQQILWQRLKFLKYLTCHQKNYWVLVSSISMGWMICSMKQSNAAKRKAISSSSWHSSATYQIMIQLPDMKVERIKPGLMGF